MHGTHDMHAMHSMHSMHSMHDVHGQPTERPGHGEGMHHRFDDVDAWARQFDDPARDAWQRPDTVVANLALQPDARVADIGAGTGYFAVRIARAVPRGRVWGIDIEPNMVRYLRARAQREGLANLYSTLATPDDPMLAEPVDVVLVVDTFHHLSERATYFRALRSSLRPGGRVVIIDFTAESPVGPAVAHRIAPRAVQDEMAAAGYALFATFTLPYQYMLVFR